MNCRNKTRTSCRLQQEAHDQSTCTPTTCSRLPRSVNRPPPYPPNPPTCCAVLLSCPELGSSIKARPGFPSSSTATDSRLLSPPDRPFTPTPVSPTWGKGSHRGHAGDTRLEENCRARSAQPVQHNLLHMRTVPALATQTDQLKAAAVVDVIGGNSPMCLHTLSVSFHQVAHLLLLLAAAL